MVVKSTLLTFDKKFSDRKKALGKQATWAVIMEAGILSLEKLKGFKEEISVKTIKKEAIKPTIKKEKKSEIEKPVEEIDPTPFSIEVNVGAIDIEAIIENAWTPIKYTQLELDDIIRFKDSKGIISVNDKKRFKLKQQPQLKEGTLFNFLLSHTSQGV